MGGWVSLGCCVVAYRIMRYTMSAVIHQPWVIASVKLWRKHGNKDLKFRDRQGLRFSTVSLLFAAWNTNAPPPSVLAAELKSLETIYMKCLYDSDRSSTQMCHSLVSALLFNEWLLVDKSKLWLYLASGLLLTFPHIMLSKIDTAIGDPFPGRHINVGLDVREKLTNVQLKSAKTSRSSVEKWRHVALLKLVLCGTVLRWW